MTPGGAVLSVLRIARETGWPEEFIYWLLPASRFNQYLHAILHTDGIECFWPAGSPQAEAQANSLSEELQEAASYRPDLNDGDELD